MNSILHSEIGHFSIDWDKSASIYDLIMKHKHLSGIANNIKGEVFFYQYDLDITFDGTEKEVFEKGDVVYWRSQKEKGKFGILFMYGNTTFGDGKKPQTSSPGIKIGTIANYKNLINIKTGTLLKL